MTSVARERAHILLQSNQHPQLFTAQCTYSSTEFSSQYHKHWWFDSVSGYAVHIFLLMLFICDFIHLSQRRISALHNRDLRGSKIQRTGTAFTVYIRQYCGPLKSKIKYYFKVPAPFKKPVQGTCLLHGVIPSHGIMPEGFGVVPDRSEISLDNHYLTEPDHRKKGAPYLEGRF